MDDKILHIFANNVKAHRYKLNISQERLAGLAGLHRTYIGMIERCEKNITLRNVQKIAEALQVEPSALLS